MRRVNIPNPSESIEADPGREIGGEDSCASISNALSGRCVIGGSGLGVRIISFVSKFVNLFVACPPLMVGLVSYCEATRVTLMGGLEGELW